MPRAATARSVSSAPKFFADFHEFGQVLYVFSRERIFDYGCSGGASRGRIHGLAHFGVGFFHEGDDFADFGFHRRPSSPLISEAFRPPTRAWMRGPGGHHQGQKNFVGARCVGDAHFHGVEVAAHVGGVDVRDRNIEARAGAANFFCGGDDRFCAAENFAHGVATGNVPERTVFQFAGLADNCALAVAFDDFGIAAERGDERLGHLEAERL